jgi:hypothetical protein
VIDTTSGGLYPLGAGIGLQNIDANGLGIDMLLYAGKSQVSLGDIGLSFPIHNLTAYGSGIYANNIITQDGGAINFFAPVFLEKTSLFDTSMGGGNISLQSVDSVRTGFSSFVVQAGTGTVLIEEIGVNVPMRDVLILSAVDGVLTGDIITQDGIVQIVPTWQLKKSLTTIQTFSALNNLLSAPIDLNNVIASTPSANSLSLLTGLKGSITVGNLGSEDVFLRDVIVETNQPFSIQNVYANSMAIDALSGSVSFDGDVNLSETLTVSDSNEVLLGGAMNVKSLTLQSRNSIFNQDVVYPIDVLDSGAVYLNAARGQIGTSTNPILLNASGSIVLGGNPIYITGNYSTVNYLPNNVPCVIVFQGQEIGCDSAHRVIFEGLNKSSFARFFHFNAFDLGIDFPAHWYNYKQFSPFARINPISGNLHGTVAR